MLFRSDQVPMPHRDGAGAVTRRTLAASPIPHNGGRGQASVVDVDLPVWEALEYLLESDLALEPCQRGTEAVVDAVAEAEGHRCVVRSGDESRPAGGLFGSDRRSQFVERGCGAEVSVSGIGTEFVVAAAEILYERVTTDDHTGGPVGLRSGSRYL